ncbi:hypothetical protein SAMN06295967_102314 [Belliella buryatensis]|uniref:Uncharacterized protein n=1 Tax=Belliella buryatensis TaxID=1500549 RepID=A0A239BED6_9BACT|nr:hypothetical protein SAMN06295967_102314 [Belliella buryatensis]
MLSKVILENSLFKTRLNPDYGLGFVVRDENIN